MVQRREENQVFHKDLLSLLSMRTESGEKLQLVFCYRAGDETVAFHLKKGIYNDFLKLAYEASFTDLFAS